MRIQITSTLQAVGALAWANSPCHSLSLSVVSAEVEMTAYALLTYTVLGDVASALPVVKWLSQQRNALGGFSSTQVSLCKGELMLPFPNQGDNSSVKQLHTALFLKLGVRAH